jgi:hypothetical protein
MKALLGALTVLVLMIGAPLAYAYFPPQINTAPIAKNQTAALISGLELGQDDARDTCNHPDGCHWVILMRGNGFINQTQDFIRGYVHGFCSDPSVAGGGGSDAEQADITCDDGPNGARWALPGSLDGNNTTFWTPTGQDYQDARNHDYCLHNHPEDDLRLCVQKVTD